MSILELFILAIALSMDAFAAAVCKGLAMKQMRYKNALITGCFFGGFQALMPLLGYLLGMQFERYIKSVDHWIAFGLLMFLGLKMLKESRETCDDIDASFSLKNMTVLAFATSVDALAVGVTFSFLSINIVSAVLLIGITTFIISFAGVKIGNIFGEKYKAKAEVAGGIILMLIGLKILLDHII